MPEQKTVSPLLDGLLIGAPMGSHNGISCSPAVRGNSDNRYIVKCISVPQSQSQVDALLITGALQDAAAADAYFKDRADEIFQEAELLRILARDEGFLPFDGCQYVPIGGNLPGYEVYLLSGYRLSLEKYMRRRGITHLEAVNLGIDLCAALAASRRNGLMYIDLKPSNVFITPKKEYKIGDLGFASMESLRYCSMPIKYRSPYTAPEVLDDMVVLNETVDTYAVGMLLYQVFNLGQLPVDGKQLPPPVNGDDDINAILLKACSIDPEQRYSNPAELWQALIDYMQRNTINNTQIMPPLSPSDATGTLERFQVNPLKKDALEIPPLVAVEEAEPSPAEEEEPPVEEDELPVSMPQLEESPPEPEEDPEDAEELLYAEPDDTIFPEVPEEQEEPADDSCGPNLETELEEVNRLLSSAQNSMPKLKARAKTTTPVVVKEKKKNGFLQFLKFVFIVLLLGGLGFGGWFFYENYYLQEVDALTVTGSDSRLTVTVHSEIPDRMLTVACVDAYGATKRENVHGGEAAFTDLKPGSLYKIQVEISGIHKLTGQTTEIFTTETVTKIVSFSAVTGAQDGELLLNLSVEGHEPGYWVVTYSSENEEAKTATFSGHNAAITGLAVGENYHFVLSCADGSPLMGETTLDAMASGVITAQNLRVKGIKDGVMEVLWDAHGENDALGWRARCYNDDGYDEILEVSDPAAFFPNVDPTQSYTVEVTAEGMTQPSRTTISANPITIQKFKVDSGDKDSLTVTWETQSSRENAIDWVITYCIDDVPISDVIHCDGNTAVISPRIPGATYRFMLQGPENVTVFNSETEFTTPKADRFVGHAVSSYKMTSLLLPTPNPGWRYVSTPNSAFTDQFAPGQSISMVLKVGANFYLDDVPVQVMYVVRDESGKVIPDLTLSLEANWAHLWAKEDYHYAELDTIKAPTVPGSYTLDLYLDGGFATSTPFTVS